MQAHAKTFRDECLQLPTNTSEYFLIPSSLTQFQALFPLWAVLGEQEASHGVAPASLHFPLGSGQPPIMLKGIWAPCPLLFGCSDISAPTTALQESRAQMKPYCNPRGVSFQLGETLLSLLLLVKMYVFSMPCNPLPMFLDKMFCVCSSKSSSSP